MPPLSPDARFILDRMDDDRHYELAELREFVPDVTADGLREVMHELWISRRVERVGYSSWRRCLSASPHHSVPPAAAGQTKVVKPEDLFDHDSFADFFSS